MVYQNLKLQFIVTELSFIAVQQHVIPVILDSVRLGIQTGDVGYRPRDVCVSAPTGSGKTLAFAIPIVQVGTRMYATFKGSGHYW